jgi:hypothetical protein
MNNKEYNGHYNYETWLVSLHIDNEQHYEREVQNLANNARNQYELAKDIKNFVEENMIKDENGKDITNCFLNDLINATLSEVNWQELAEGYVQENGTVFNQESVEEEV